MRLAAQGHLRISRTTTNTVLSDAELLHGVKQGWASVVFDDRNLLVNTGLQAFTRLLGGGVGAPTLGGSVFGDISNIVVTKMELGALPSPPDPDVGDTTGVGVSTNPADGANYNFYYVPNLIVTYPTDYSVRFSGLLPTSEGVGVTVTGECLKLANGAIFAKKTFSRNKTAAFALQFDHTISIIRA